MLENVKVKNYMRKNIKPTGAGIKRTKRDEPEGDLWGCSAPNIAVKKARDVAFLKASKPVIARIVMPLHGQSVNASKDAVKEVIEKVCEEEMVDIKEEVKIDEFLNPDVDAVSKPVEESEGSDNEEITGVKGISMNEPVTRDGLLSKTQRRRRREHKQQLKAIQKKKDTNIREAAERELRKVKLAENKIRKARVAEIKAEEDAEQAADGVVKRPARLGRFKYTMKKTDF